MSPGEAAAERPGLGQRVRAHSSQEGEESRATDERTSVYTGKEIAKKIASLLTARRSRNASSAPVFFAVTSCSAS